MKVELDYTSLLMEFTVDMAQRLEAISDAVYGIRNTRSFAQAASMIASAEARLDLIWTVAGKTSGDEHTRAVQNDMMDIWVAKIDEMRALLEKERERYWWKD